MYIDHVGINTNDMEATCILLRTTGLRLVRTTRTLTDAGITTSRSAAAMPSRCLMVPSSQGRAPTCEPPGTAVATSEEFDAAYKRLKDHGVAVTEIIERGYGKTFYFHDPNGIRLINEMKTRQDLDSLESDPDPVPQLARSSAG